MEQLTKLQLGFLLRFTQGRKCPAPMEELTIMHIEFPPGPTQDIIFFPPPWNGTNFITLQLGSLFFGSDKIENLPTPWKKHILQLQLCFIIVIIIILHLFTQYRKSPTPMEHLTISQIRFLFRFAYVCANFKRLPHPWNNEPYRNSHHNHHHDLGLPGHSLGVGSDLRVLQ